GVQDQLAPVRGVDRLPELERIVGSDPIEVDDGGMRTGAEANQTTGDTLTQADGDPQPAFDDRVDRLGVGAIDEGFRLVESFDLAVGSGARTAADEPQLTQTCPGAGDHAERAGRDLQVQTPAIAVGYALELGGVLRQQPREHI